MQADYSTRKADDRDEFLQARRLGQRHARALLDFHGKDADELTFKKNDIITIVSEKDEHCWVGQLDGTKGWFPAKFVKASLLLIKQLTCVYCVDCSRKGPALLSFWGRKYSP